MAGPPAVPAPAAGAVAVPPVPAGPAAPLADTFAVLARRALTPHPIFYYVYRILRRAVMRYLRRTGGYMFEIIYALLRAGLIKTDDLLGWVQSIKLDIPWKAIIMITAFFKFLEYIKRFSM